MNLADENFEMNFKNYAEFEQYKLDLVEHLKIFELHYLAEEADEDSLDNFVTAMVQAQHEMCTRFEEPDKQVLFLYNLALVSLAKLILKHGEKEIL
jgi:hypothetical protein